MASKIAATGRYTKDAEQRRAWFESLTKIMAGNETFSPPRAKENADSLRDPCFDTIKEAFLEVPFVVSIVTIFPGKPGAFVRTQCEHERW